MLVHRTLEGIRINKAVVTTGSFDGVHIGHNTILNRLNTIARATGGESALISFHPHPRKILYPETQGKDLQMINTQREKIMLLEKTGLDHLIILPFTIEFSRITSIDFIRQILVGKLQVKWIVVGFNHHFGHNREGDFDYLFELGKYYGFSVEEIPEQDIHNEFVSSTRIRKALSEGNIQRANAYLDHEYFIYGLIRTPRDFPVEFFGRWLEILPEEPEKQLPPSGIYAGSMGDPGSRQKVLIRICDSIHGKSVLIGIPSVNGFIPRESGLYFNKRLRTIQHDDEYLPSDLEIDFRDIDQLIY